MREEGPFVMVQQTNTQPVECCSWCRQPVNQCRQASCDDAPTYDGVLHFGQWMEAEPDTFVSAE